MNAAKKLIISFIILLQRRRTLSATALFLALSFGDDARLPHPKSFSKGEGL